MESTIVDRVAPREASEKLRAAERLRYQDIEKALTALQRISPQGIAAFRARLRHLRDVGVPAYLPKPGRGRVIDYSSMDALEMFLALRLENLNQPPMIVASLANQMMIGYWHDAAAEMAGKLDDLVVIIFPSDVQPQDYSHVIGTRWFSSFPPVLFFRGVGRMPELEKYLPDEISRINVSAVARRIFNALEKVVPDR
jgi:hypothetical protein